MRVNLKPVGDFRSNSGRAFETMYFVEGLSPDDFCWIGYAGNGKWVLSWYRAGKQISLGHTVFNSVKEAAEAVERLVGRTTEEDLRPVLTEMVQRRIDFLDDEIDMLQLRKGRIRDDDTSMVSEAQQAQDQARAFLHVGDLQRALTAAFYAEMCIVVGNTEVERTENLFRAIREALTEEQPRPQREQA